MAPKTMFAMVETVIATVEKRATKATLCAGLMTPIWLGNNVAAKPTYDPSQPAGPINKAIPKRDGNFEFAPLTLCFCKSLLASIIYLHVLYYIVNYIVLFFWPKLKIAFNENDFNAIITGIDDILKESNTQ